MREVDADEAVDGDARHGEGRDEAVGVEEEGEGHAHAVAEHAVLRIVTVVVSGTITTVIAIIQVAIQQ